MPDQMDEQTAAAVVISLDRERRAYRRLLKATRAVQRALLRGDRSAIEATTAEADQAAQRALQVGSERQMAAAAANPAAAEAAHRPLADVIGRLPDAKRKRAQEALAELSSLLAEIEQVNQRNAALLDQSVRLFEFGVQLVAGARTMTHYGAAGAAGKGAPLFHALDREG